MTFHPKHQHISPDNQNILLHTHNTIISPTKLRQYPHLIPSA